MCKTNCFNCKFCKAQWTPALHGIFFFNTQTIDRCGNKKSKKYLERVYASDTCELFEKQK